MGPLPTYEVETNPLHGFFQTPPLSFTNPPPPSTSHLPLLKGFVRSVHVFPLQVLLPCTRELLGLCSLLMNAFPRGLGDSGQEREIYFHHEGLRGGGIAHWREQLLLLCRQGKFFLVKILSGHDGRPVAASPSGGCALFLRKGTESEMLLGTAKQNVSHELWVQAGFGIGLMDVLVLSALSGFFRRWLQVFSVTGFWLPFRFDFWLVSGRLVFDLKRTRITLHLQASLGPLVRWSLARSFDTHSLPG